MNDHSQLILSGIAMVMVGALGFALVFHAVPHENAQLVTFVLGALSGALVVGGGQKLADKIATPKPGDASSSQQ